MEKINMAGGDDVVAMQVGRFVGPDDTPPTSADPTGPVRTAHVVSGNARVGTQTTDAVADITIVMSAA